MIPDCAAAIGGAQDAMSRATTLRRRGSQARRFHLIHFNVRRAAFHYAFRCHQIVDFLRFHAFRRLLSDADLSPGAFQRRYAQPLI